jgi:hypothetical protein
MVRRQLKLVLSVSADDISANQLRREHYPGRRRKLPLPTPKQNRASCQASYNSAADVDKLFHCFAQAYTPLAPQSLAVMQHANFRTAAQAAARQAPRML